MSKGVDKTVKVSLHILPYRTYALLIGCEQDPDEFTALELAEVSEHEDIIALLR